MSALIPGLFALIQAIGVDDKCPTSNNTILFKNLTHHHSNNSRKNLNESNRLKPLFSVSIYFVLILVLLVLCFISFTFLHYSKIAKKYRKTNNINNLNTKKEKIEEEEATRILNENIKKERFKICILLVVTFIGSFLMYGYLPGLLSYSTMPYGNIYFHLSVNLSKFILFHFNSISNYFKFKNNKN
jgi:riboflavin transporter 2